MRSTDRSRLHHALATPVRGAVAVSGGYSPAERWRVRLADGTSVFVKIGATPGTAHALRAEQAAYTRLATAPIHIAPQRLAWVDGDDRPLLVLEDLSDAHWPPPWREGDLDRVHRASAVVAGLPGDWPALELESLAHSWQRIAADPAPFLSTRLCSLEWLERSLPTLLDAARAAPANADAVCHFDMRGDNLCLVGDRAILIDWNHAGRGPVGLDTAFMAPSVRLEGGPLPDTFAAQSSAHAVWVAGYFAAAAGKPQIPDAPRVRRFQHRQLRIALPWACRVLGLDPPDGDWARRAMGRTDRRLDRGELDVHTWQRTLEEDLIDAYLSTDDPRLGSGKAGDAQDWRWSRELILDAVPRSGATILDVGCANGHLMESLERWALQRDLVVEVHGVEISERMAHVARGRLPDLAARIHVGDIVSWQAPQRYDVVHLGLDCCPPDQKGALLRRVLAELLTPGGRLVIRAERVDGEQPDPVTALRTLGFEPDGILQRKHPMTGAVRRTAFLVRMA